jgi:hypothetical protein
VLIVSDFWNGLRSEKVPLPCCVVRNRPSVDMPPNRHDDVLLLDGDDAVRGLVAAFGVSGESIDILCKATIGGE